MPKVFTGKVVIRGDQLDDYLQALEVEEKAKAPFRQYMKGLLQDTCKNLQDRP